MGCPLYFEGCIVQDSYFFEANRAIGRYSGHVDRGLKFKMREEINPCVSLSLSHFDVRQ